MLHYFTVTRSKTGHKRHADFCTMGHNIPHKSVKQNIIYNITKLLFIGGQ